MKRYSVILLTVFLISTGCNDIIGNCVDITYFPHCVESYYSISSIDVDKIDVTIDGEKYCMLNVGALKNDFVNHQNGAEEFETLSQEHHDYGGEHISPFWFQDRYYPKKDIKSIEVTTKTQWDGKHPQGSSLNDICHFLSFSAYPYILNGYQEIKCIPNHSKYLEYALNNQEAMERLCGDYSIPVDKLLSELEKDDTVLIGKYDLFALFLPDPDTPGSKEISIKITDRADREFSTDVILK